jgi:microcystin-dependent protein
MSEPFIGEIKMVGFNFPPQGWAFCDGQLLSIAQNAALFSLLGTTFGGDGETTFGLPDLRGRNSINPGNGPGLPPVTWGQKAGTHNYSIGVNHLPPHTHGATALKVGVNSNSPDTDDPSGATFSASGEDAFREGAANAEMHDSSVTGTTDATGGGQALNITEPYLGVYHVIALFGIFPSQS